MPPGEREPGDTLDVFHAWFLLLVGSLVIAERFELGALDLIACPAAKVGKGFAGLRDKFPIVARGVKCEFQNSERIRLANFTVGFRTREGAV